MSLINDALRRTRDIAYAGATRPPTAAPPYRFGQPTITPRTAWLMATALAIVTASAATALLLAYRQHITPPANTASTVSATPQPTVSEDELVARLLAKLQQQQSAPPPPTALDPVTPPPTPPPAPVAPEPPKLTLQGITTDGMSPEAMINGFSVRVGEEIDGYQVVAIESRFVRLRFGERELTLRMP